MSKRIDLFNHDKGLGDTISRAINSITGGIVKECGGCQKRKEYLNNNNRFNQFNRGRFVRINGVIVRIR